MQQAKEDKPALVRLDSVTLDAIEDWRRSQSRIPSRTEAVRELVTKALSGDAQRSVA
jgi:hypothetical protein